jgi:multidrug efflux pump subunit AcrA (membrane-fusion protein)
VFFIGRSYFAGKRGDYILSKVGKHSITEIISESGTVTTTSKVNIYSPTNGIVSEVFVANGDKVTEKQKLFSVKSTATQQEKAAVYAAYKAAITALATAENTRRSTIATVDRVHDDVKNHDNDESFTQIETRTAAEAANDWGSGSRP